MKKHGLNYYLIFLSDEHLSEYVSPHDQMIEYFCGFTGTNAVLLVSARSAELWTDGRYYLQAEREMEGTGVVLFRAGTAGVPDVPEYLRTHLKKGMKFGYNGRTASYLKDRAFQAVAEKTGSVLEKRYDLAGEVCDDRPLLPAGQIQVLDMKYAGVSARAKIASIRNVLSSREADAFVLSSLTDIAWLLNLRGSDIESTPVFYSHVILTARQISLYVQPQAVTPEVLTYLKSIHVKICDYASFYDDLKKLSAKRVLLDPMAVTAACCDSIPKKIKRLFAENPTELKKAVKNDVEVKNTRQAHITDGIVMCRFIRKIKTCDHIGDYTEYDLAQMLDQMRAEQDDFIDVSFSTISAYGPNAASMHYTATKEHHSRLEPKGFLLVDSGGHYYTGTTDITRTIALGKLTDLEKEAFTLVLKSALRLMFAHFPKGVTGANLDVLARGIMWNRGLDYRCSTGHGVGHILSVHEGPNAFHWKSGFRRPAALEPNMITTDEPGLYYDGSFGIRTENELLCVFDRESEYGTFYRFEPITYAPIDLDAVLTDRLSEEEKRQLNTYHAKVYETIAPHLTREEAAWLKEATRPV